MEDDLKNYKSYSRDVKRLLVASGIWPQSNLFISRPIAYLGAFCNFIITLGLINFCTYHVDNVMIIAKCMGISISFFSSFLKVKLITRLVYLHKSILYKI
jgi:hypothetical protein